MNDSTAILRRSIAAFLLESGMSRTAFGMQAVRNPAFVFRLNAGKNNPTMSTVDRATRFMAEWRERNNHRMAGATEDAA